MHIATSAALLLTCLAAAPAAAQSIRGKLRDADTREPIVTGEVALLWGESGYRAVANSTTDSAGNFLVKGKQPGWYRLRARRIGYEEVISPPITVTPGDAMEVELVMSASAVPLAPLTILARAAPAGNLRLAMAGFYERRKTWGREGLGMGYFLDGADLNRHNYERISHVLQEIPGVHVTGCGGRELCITMRTVTRLIQAQTEASVLARGLASGECTPSFYIDGQYFDLHGESIDHWITGWSLAAVEVYPSINRPPRFANMVEEPCGAIVLWTGGRDEGRDTTAKPNR